MRGQFTFYRSYYEALKVLPKKDQVSVVLAICAYALDEEDPVLSGVPLSVFTLIRPTLDAGRNKAKNRINKTKTNEEQSNNKTEQSHKEKEGEKEVEKEGENDSYLPPAPLSGGTPAQNPPEPKAKPKPGKPHGEDWGFGPVLTGAFESWLAYKHEKRQDYKPTGLQSLVSQIRTKAAEYGEDAVADLIRECMASNWQGIIWDRLERKKQSRQTQQPRKSWAELAREMEARKNDA